VPRRPSSPDGTVVSACGPILTTRNRATRHYRPSTTYPYPSPRAVYVGSPAVLAGTGPQASTSGGARGYSALQGGASARRWSACSLLAAYVCPPWLVIRHSLQSTVLGSKPLLVVGAFGRCACSRRRTGICMDRPPRGSRRPPLARRWHLASPWQRPRCRG